MDFLLFATLLVPAIFHSQERHLKNCKGIPWKVGTRFWVVVEPPICKTCSSNWITFQKELGMKWMKIPKMFQTTIWRKGCQPSRRDSPFERINIKILHHPYDPCMTWIFTGMIALYILYNFIESCLRHVNIICIPYKQYV